ncbi:MAG: hypothetical protein PHO34_04150 [Candidatus Omnitrophica bacterium]|nr:hypothetical protein [Candidatus Omnitrophota bacterium]MDD5042553.1 hypothetical protein [Candidatus Omnitrophota bacterium]MDD5501069.1 hypothetical protein [Candidatus Omnitrophota bacterium]
MAKNKPTPEEQLLNLIEDPQISGNLNLRRRKPSPFSFLSFNSLSASFARFKLSMKDWLVQLKGGIDEPNLKAWNKILAVSAAILFVYLTADFTLRRLDIKQFTRKVASEKGRSFSKNVNAEVKPFLYYLEMVQRRDIFSPIKLRGAENPEDETKKALVEMSKDLKLVGISWGDTPEVIIEDTKANKTYFLKAGESVNKFKITTILRDKVVLEAEGQKLELT